MSDYNTDDDSVREDSENKGPKAPKRRTFNKDSRHYIDREEYTRELLEYQRTGKASERLGELYKINVDRYGSSAKFKSYTYLDEMKGQALLFLMKYSYKNFDPKKSTNAFAYCTTIIHNAFLQVINKEKKHSKLKDDLIKAQDRIDPDRSRFTILENIILDDDE